MSGLNAPTSNFVVLAVPTPVFVSCDDSMLYMVSATGHLEPCLPVGTPHPLTVWFVADADVADARLYLCKRIVL